MDKLKELNNFSFIIPVLNNFKYTLFTYNNIRTQYPEIEIVIVSKSTDETDEYFNTLSDDNLVFKSHDLPTLSHAYNLAVSLSTKEIIALIHNDMAIGDNFVETILDSLEPNMILTYTRVEPPIFPDTYAGKEIQDFGRDLTTFDNKSFNNYVNITHNEQLIEGGSQLFFACYKQDYIGLDGDTFELFCEDDDIHLRYRLGKFNMKVSTKAKVYHLVSKTSRKKDLSHIENQSNINFVKKWGFRHNIQPRYKKQLNLINGNPQLEQTLKPWFDSEGGITVTIDGSKFTQQEFQWIQNLPLIVEQSGTIGIFELGSLHLNITKIEDITQQLIKYA